MRDTIENMRHRVVAGIIAFIFLVTAIFTISDYGINWDEPAHFLRGYAYTDFFLSGGNTNPPISSARKSVFHTKEYNAAFWLKNEYGHPPVNDILFAATNKLFFEQLGWIQDIEAFSLAGIVISSLFVFLFAFFAIDELGMVGGIVSALSLSLYPLFFAETHFNVKDPPELVFFSMTLIFFYRAVARSSWKYVVLAGISFGLAFGTKFNAVFLPFIAVPWVILFSVDHWGHITRLRSQKIIVFSLPLIIVIGSLIFYVTWPFLWANPVKNFLTIVEYYRGIGTATNYQPEYLWNGFNMYPALWIILTTPVSVLGLSIIGGIWAIYRCIRNNGDRALSSLILLWAVVPVIRVTIPGSSIYGGVRQIMEFVPAMALLAGFGARFLVNCFRTKRLRTVVLVLIFGSFLFTSWKLLQYHPNEDVYFNELAGGLKGAYEKKISAAGEDLGNAFRQGMNWFTAHAEKGAKATLITRGATIIPKTWLSHDMTVSDDAWSGLAQKGEYIIQTTSVGWTDAFYFKSFYVERFLQPVYEVVTDGAPILKIWKNDAFHTRPGYQFQRSIEASFARDGKDLIIGLPREVRLTKLELIFGNDGCIPPDYMKIGVWTGGDKWYSPYSLVTQAGDGGGAYVLKPTSLVHEFPADKALKIGLFSEEENVCAISQARRATVWFLDSGARNNTSSSLQ